MEAEFEGCIRRLFYARRVGCIVSWRRPPASFDHLAHLSEWARSIKLIGQGAREDHDGVGSYGSERFNI